MCFLSYHIVELKETIQFDCTFCCILFLLAQSVTEIKGSYEI